MVRIGFEAEFLFHHLDDDDTREYGPHDTAPWSACRKLANVLETYVGARVVAPRRATLERPSPITRWAVVPEYDVDPGDYDCGGGAEIISPPLTVRRFRAAFISAAEMVAAHGFTTGRCGVHLNISCAALTSLDPLCLALSPLEDKLLGRFKRRGRQALRPIRAELVAYLLRHPEFLANSTEWLSEHLRSVVPSAKPFATNLKPLSEFGYIEFRHTGGEDWEFNEDAILRSAEELVQEIDLSSSPKRGAVALRRRLERLRLEVGAVLAFKGEHLIELSPEEAGLRTFGRDLFLNGSRAGYISAYPAFQEGDSPYTSVYASTPGFRRAVSFHFNDTEALEEKAAYALFRLLGKRVSA